MIEAGLVLLDTDSIISVESEETQVIELAGGDLLVVQEEDIKILTIAEQGTPGITTVVTVPEEEMLYAKRVDNVNDEVIYKGEAQPGSSETDAVWRIRKLIIGTDGDVSELWANGETSFSYAWTTRSQLTYL